MSAIVAVNFVRVNWKQRPPGSMARRGVDHTYGISGRCLRTAAAWGGGFELSPRYSCGTSIRTFAVPGRFWKADVPPNPAVHAVSRTGVHAVLAANTTVSVDYDNYTIAAATPDVAADALILGEARPGLPSDRVIRLPPLHLAKIDVGLPLQGPSFGLRLPGSRLDLTGGRTGFSVNRLV
jgi:hypothetical protein